MPDAYGYAAWVTQIPVTMGEEARDEADRTQCPLFAGGTSQLRAGVETVGTR